MSRYRIVFMGTPEFAVPSLRALAQLEVCEIAGVVTQPDRPAGRGRHLTPPPVKVAAETLGLPVVQVATLRDAAARAPLVNWQPDAFVVAAFGLILGRKTLAIPRLAAINVHASLLPAYRGASPIATAIACGEHETGVSLMRMETGLDTGPVYCQETMPVEPGDTTETLAVRLAVLGARMLASHLPAILGADIPAMAQTGPASLTRPLTKADGWLDWSRPAAELARHVRAMLPWPRAWTTLSGGTQLQVLAADARLASGEEVPGSVSFRDGALRVACGDGSLEIATAQLAGSRPASGADLMRGRKLAPGDRLGQTGAPGSAPPLVTLVP